MDHDTADAVVAQLQAWNIPASRVPRGLHTAAVRVRLGGGREALWEADGATGLHAQVLRDGVLVGYVESLSDRPCTPAQLAWLIGSADYDLSPRARTRDRAVTTGPAGTPGQTASPTVETTRRPAAAGAGDRSSTSKAPEPARRREPGPADGARMLPWRDRTASGRRGWAPLRGLRGTPPGP